MSVVLEAGILGWVGERKIGGGDLCDPSIGDETGRIGSGEARDVRPTCYPDRSSP